MVSPKKTWEGSIGGLVGATLFGAAAGTWWFLPELGPVRGALAGALASTAGQIGDLVESLWKRGAGVKDSGPSCPGTEASMTGSIPCFLRPRSWRLSWAQAYRMPGGDGGAPRHPRPE